MAVVRILAMVCRDKHEEELEALVHRTAEIVRPPGMIGWSVLRPASTIEPRWFLVTAWETEGAWTSWRDHMLTDEFREEIAQVVEGITWLRFDVVAEEWPTMPS